jgi:hypothetical protein
MGEERTGLFSLSQACWSDQHVFFAKLFFLQPVQLFKTCGALFLINKLLELKLHLDAETVCRNFEAPNQAQQKTC